MFGLNFDKIDQYTFRMKYVALMNLFAAWYMLVNLKTSIPSIDPILAKIYFSEYGIPIEGLSDGQISRLAQEYKLDIANFFIKCETQRCQNIVERFGKVGIDNRLQHVITLPMQSKHFFLELLELNIKKEIVNSHTKETQCLDSLLNSMIINNTMNVSSNMNGIVRGELAKDYTVLPEQFASYVDIINRAIVGLYRPLDGLAESFEDWGTKFRRVIDYVKTLVFMITRDVAFSDNEMCVVKGVDSIVDRKVPFGNPFVELSIQDELFTGATKSLARAYNAEDAISQIQAAVMPYSGLKIEHAICLFHNTNAQLSVNKIPQTRNSNTFKFLCCQEYISYIDSKLKEQLLNKFVAHAPQQA